MASTTLRIAPTLVLPLAAVTSTLAILGRRGTGKTTTGVVFVEALLKAHQQVLIIDPTDVWYGLRSSADGQRPGFPVCVLGGLHADLPLEGTDGKVIADFLVDTGASLICSLGHFESQEQERRFVSELARRLYYRKGQQAQKTPLFVVIDEASRLIPQLVRGREGWASQCVGALQQLVRQGRSRGFGVGLIDQRPATLNKDVLTQVEMLVCHSVSSPQDQKAVQAWIEQHDSKDREKEFMASLASLPRGTAWFWSPALELFDRVPVQNRTTFDSSRTPAPGEVVAAPDRVAKVDLDALKAQLSTTIEKARADDPVALRKQIAELQRAAKKNGHGAAPAREKLVIDEAAIARAVERAVRDVESRYVRQRRDRTGRLTNVVASLRANAGALAKTADTIAALVEGDVDVAPAYIAPPPVTVATRALPVQNARAAVAASAAGERPDLVSSSQLGMLVALRRLEVCGIKVVRFSLCAAFSGQSWRSSAFERKCAALRSLGFVTYPRPSWIALTDAGRAVVSDTPSPATLGELHDAVMAQVSEPRARILAALIARYPDPLTRAQLAEQVSQSTTSSAWERNLATLRSLGLIDYPDSDHAVATDVLFPAGLA